MNLWQYYNGDLKYPDLNNHSHEKEIAKTNPKWAFDYVSKHGKDEELESIISTSSCHSYWYAIHVLYRKRFELGEPAIAKNTEYSKEYTQEVLKKDFILNGKLICKYKG